MKRVVCAARQQSILYAAILTLVHKAGPYPVSNYYNTCEEMVYQGFPLRSKTGETYGVNT